VRINYLIQKGFFKKIGSRKFSAELPSAMPRAGANLLTTAIRQPMHDA
jgi:hypothetical protein